MRSQTVVIIPAFNEESTIGQVIDDVRRQGFKYIIVVDDGSSDNTSRVARKKGVVILRRSINRGMGAATQKGIEYGLYQGFRYFLTIDADQQQNASDLVKILEKLQEHDCVIGSRFLQKNIIPFSRRTANKIANVVTGILFGVWVSDSQTGLRGFSRRVAKNLNLCSDGFEYASEFLWEVQEMGYQIHEVPITISYSKYSLAKGQGFFVGIKTFWRLLKNVVYR
ncbi:glycosyltransferase family 2 protein [Candidatus Gracilibacteria bacterium]|nr:glycosyltransferase family 2 protein [Candidatus Gracilibacteria bacterium]